MEVTLSVMGEASLEHECPQGHVDWLFVASGRWSQDAYHSGYIAYYLAKTAPDTWILQSVESDPDSDDFDLEDVEGTTIDDSQTEASSTTSEPDGGSWQRLVAICRGAPLNCTPQEIAAELYRQVCRAQRFSIDERDDFDGLLNPRS